MREMGEKARLCEDCAKAYAEATGLGCTISEASGKIIREFGSGCGRCALCAAAGIDRRKAEDAHLYGMSEAARFGGKYIYFCPLGLTCFVTPFEMDGAPARMTVGPFRMVSFEDYADCDLAERLEPGSPQYQRVLELASAVPYVEPRRVRALSDLLFYAAAYLGDMSASTDMLSRQGVESLQEELSGYIASLKESGQTQRYPLLTEKQLIAAISGADSEEARRLLNELLGYIFFSTGGDFARIKARAYELIVLISRAAADGGADAAQTLEMSERYFQEIQKIETVDALCFWLTGAMNAYLENVFRFAEVRHFDVIHKAIAYMRSHLTEKISLEEVAEHVYLTPSYFSRMFKKEMDCNFSFYLNKLRVERSLPLVLGDSVKLADIAQMCGFEDQSYYTKVFKRLVGVTPSIYREKRGHIHHTEIGDNQEIHTS